MSASWCSVSKSVCEAATEERWRSDLDSLTKPGLENRDLTPPAGPCQTRRRAGPACAALAAADSPARRPAAADEAAQEHRAAVAADRVVVTSHVAVDPVPHGQLDSRRLDHPDARRTNRRSAMRVPRAEPPEVWADARISQFFEGNRPRGSAARGNRIVRD